MAQRKFAKPRPSCGPSPWPSWWELGGRGCCWRPALLQDEGQAAGEAPLAACSGTGLLFESPDASPPNPTPPAKPAAAAGLAAPRLLRHRGPATAGLRGSAPASVALPQPPSGSHRILARASSSPPGNSCVWGTSLPCPHPHQGRMCPRHWAGAVGTPSSGRLPLDESHPITPCLGFPSGFLRMLSRALVLALCWNEGGAEARRDFNGHGCLKTSQRPGRQPELITLPGH